MERTPIDPAEVFRTARDLSQQFGPTALMQVQERIIQADSEGSEQEVDFWQQVSRVMQSSYSIYPF